MPRLRPRKGALPTPRLPVLRYQLACGARLLVSPRPGAPVLAAQVHLRGGHALDPSGLEGLSYLTGALLDQGTARHSEEEIAGLLERLGGSLSGDATGLSGSIAGAEWKLLLELVCEFLTQPVYPAEKFERQRQRLLDRLLVDRDDPRVQGGILFRRLVYGRHWMGRPYTGSPKSVARVRREHLLKHHREHWCGRRALIAVCGDVDPEAVRRLLDKGLAGWRVGADLPPWDENFPPMERRVTTFRARRQQVHVYLGHLGIKRSDPDYPTLVVLDHILGAGPGFTNRIARRLRDEQGLAYSVHAAIHASAGILPGTFTAYIGTSPEHVGTAVHGFLEEIERMRAQPVRPDELELAQNYLVGSYALGFERAAQRANYVLTAERHGFPDDHLERLLASFQAVKPADVLAAARRHLHPERSCLAAAGSVSERELDALLAGRRGKIRAAGRR